MRPQGMAALITWNILRGQTSLDTFKPSRRRSKPDQPYDTLVCIPEQGSNPADIHSVSVFHLTPGERLYDLGWSRNLMEVFSRPFFRDKTTGQRSVGTNTIIMDISHPSPCSGVYVWPKLNPSILSRFWKEALAKRVHEPADGIRQSLRDE